MSDYVRVRDNDTGHERTIRASRVGAGNYKVLDGPAVDERTGEPLPPRFATRSPKPAEKPADAVAPRGDVKETGHKATNEIKES